MTKRKKLKAGEEYEAARTAFHKGSIYTGGRFRSTGRRLIDLSNHRVIAQRINGKIVFQENYTGGHPIHVKVPVTPILGKGSRWSLVTHNANQSQWRSEIIDALKNSKKYGTEWCAKRLLSIHSRMELYQTLFRLAHFDIHLYAPEVSFLIAARLNNEYDYNCQALQKFDRKNLDTEPVRKNDSPSVLREAAEPTEQDQEDVA